VLRELVENESRRVRCCAHRRVEASASTPEATLDRMHFDPRLGPSLVVAMMRQGRALANSARATARRSADVIAVSREMRREAVAAHGISLHRRRLCLAGGAADEPAPPRPARRPVICQYCGLEITRPTSRWFSQAGRCAGSSI
jgi:hypothetical protein